MQLKILRRGLEGDQTRMKPPLNLDLLLKAKIVLLMDGWVSEYRWWAVLLERLRAVELFMTCGARGQQ